MARRAGHKGGIFPNWTVNEENRDRERAEKKETGGRNKKRKKRKKVWWKGREEEERVHSAGSRGGRNIDHQTSVVELGRVSEFCCLG